MKRQFIKTGAGRPPAVALVNPKYGHNVAGAFRNCAAFGMQQLWVTGSRVSREWEKRGRLPREERMRRYGNVEVLFGDYFFDAFQTRRPEPGKYCEDSECRVCGKPKPPPGLRNPTVPIAVEVQRNAEPLTTFQHPLNALYVFGPEDGTLGKATLRQCHRFLIIPSDNCLNLAVAVGVVLAHRRMSLQQQGLEPLRPSYQTMQEERGFADDDQPFKW